MSDETASRGFVSEGVTGAGNTATEAPNPMRRSFLRNMSGVGLASTAAMLFGDLPLLRAQGTSANQDTVLQILTAALIAEDLATTFYYSGLTGPVIQDPALAGPGGSATNVTAGGNLPNVTYLRAALGQEIAHANLLRAVGNLGSSATSDPYQTFYFAAGTFDNLAQFTDTLAALENAFIGAYLNAIREIATLGLRQVVRNVPDGAYGGPFSANQHSYFAEVVASILGVECEHRVLVGVINNVNQPNDFNFEQTDGITAVYHGSTSAVAALTPFLTPSTGTGVTLSAALAAAVTLAVPSSGNPPAQ